MEQYHDIKKKKEKKNWHKIAQCIKQVRKTITPCIKVVFVFFFFETHIFYTIV